MPGVVGKNHLIARRRKRRYPECDVNGHSGNNQLLISRVLDLYYCIINNNSIVVARAMISDMAMVTVQ